jgi:hypothetical protein
VRQGERDHVHAESRRVRESGVKVASVKDLTVSVLRR